MVKLESRSGKQGLANHRHHLWMVTPAESKSTKKAVLRMQNAFHARVLPRIRRAKPRLKDKRLKISS
ncbi:hypothetical protein GQ55_8G221600 [Panicum hallii var. hallii]|uniref:Uncharacterized protein n=1 Tax=Panicum hallii var. hallii TaxID=1504633 RepID=A0A2T7CQ27_9POAL|nr:hypothetical protein GQ55_8G221600 [Panicum hallii var. hallii]